MVKEKLMTLMPAFEIEIAGNACGRIEKKFTLFSPKYEIDCNGWHVEGISWAGNTMSIQNAVR